MPMGVEGAKRILYLSVSFSGVTVWMCGWISSSANPISFSRWSVWLKEAPLGTT